MQTWAIMTGNTDKNGEVTDKTGKAADKGREVTDKTEKVADKIRKVTDKLYIDSSVTMSDCFSI